jgi:SAM-dependent methyltransferase
VLNKLKNIFMADKVISRGKEWPTETNHGTMPDNWAPTEELTALDLESDPEYLEHSAEAVGYGNRKLQWNAYRSIANYIPEGDSVLDFGCARGDFKLYHADDYKFDLDYIGVDMNENLINAGKKVYEGRVDIRLQDWFSLPKDLIQDWCINIGSSNLRYDANVKLSDDEYLKKTIHTMVGHANNGVVLLLTSSINDIDDGLINRNPGDILNWAQKEFGSVAVDHSFSNDVFILVIYK